MSISIQDCRKPPNGGGCVRDEDFEEVRREQQSTTTLMHRFQERVTSEFLGVFGTMSRIETKVDRLLEGYEIGNVRPAADVLPDVDYDPDEPTLTGREPEMAATLWKARNAESLERETDLRAKLAAAQATIDATEAERKRNSDRALAIADRRWSKWQKIGAGILALTTSLGIGTLLAKLLGG